MRGYVLFAITALLWISREVVRPAQQYAKEKGLHDTMWIQPNLVPLNDSSLLKEIDRAGIVFPNIVFKQAHFETDHLRCQNCSLDSNNLFGYTSNFQAGHLKFPSWQYSVWYYAGWQRGRGAFQATDYYKFLSLAWGKGEQYSTDLKNYK